MTLYTAGEIQEGQRAWLSAGGQQLGTVWGHGSYVAPDWSADWLHREATEYRDIRSTALYGKPYAKLALQQRGSVDALVKDELRANTYDAATNTITVTPHRALAIAHVQSHYTALFGDDPRMQAERERYAMMDNLLPRAEDRKALAGFFFWSAWVDREHHPAAGRHRRDGSGISTRTPKSPIPRCPSAIRS